MIALTVGLGNDRDAYEDVLDILEAEGPPEKVIFHCFSGDAAMAKRCAEAGYVMSFAGNITFKNAGALWEAASATWSTLPAMVRRIGQAASPIPGTAELCSIGRC